VPSTAKAVSSVPEPVEALAWGSVPSSSADFYPIADGMCIHGEVFPVENGAVFTYGQSTGGYSRGHDVTAVVIEPDGLHRTEGQGFGAALSGDLAGLGGRLPDALWAVRMTGGRMQDSSELLAGKTSETKWNTSVAGYESGKSALVRPMYKDHDGTTVFGLETTTNDSGKKSLSVFRLDENGKILRGAKVPGVDVSTVAFQSEHAVAVREDGEVFAYDEARKTLVRWSPKTPVKDIQIPGAPKSSIVSHVKSGIARTVVNASGSFWNSDGMIVTLSKLKLPANAGHTWTLGPDDSLLVPGIDGKLYIETAAGETREEAIPPGAKNIGYDHGVLWMVARATGEKESDEAFFVKSADRWVQRTLAALPFSRDSRGALAIEKVHVTSADDIFLNTRRIEKGIGWQVSEPYRAIYRSRKPMETLRCQDTPTAESGIGLWSWPPTASTACKTPFLVIAREPDKKKGRTSYPGIAQELKGLGALGERSTFMHFKGQGGLYLGMKPSSVQAGESIAGHLAKRLALRPELVCGEPTPERVFTYDGANGSFEFSKVP
jgi:hypothetical protein